MPWIGFDPAIQRKMMRTEINWIDQTRAGDICRPLRLLVQGDTLFLWAGVEFAAEAERIAHDPGCLSACLTVRMAAEGYRPLPRAMVPIARFTAETVTAFSGETACRITPEQPTLLTHSSAELAETGGWGILRDGLLVSAAWAMPDSTGDKGAREIALETAPAYRRQGLATAAAAALICDLFSAELRPIYRCAEDNAASMAVARALGLRRIGTEYAPAFRRAK